MKTTFNSLQTTIHRQGGWFKNQCDVIASHLPKDVLEYFYPVEIIENYLNDKRVELTDLITDWIKVHRELLWSETGEPVVLDSLFFETLIEYDGDLKQFKRALANRKFSVTQLAEIRGKLLLLNIFYNPKEREL